MKKIFLIAAFLLAVISFWVCSSPRSAVVAERPAPVVVRTPPPRPGYIWIDRGYKYQGGRYVWMNGYWAAPRQNHAWVPGYWQKARGGWHWVGGRWR